MLGALDNQTSARLVPLQNPDLRGYAAYSRTTSTSTTV